MGESISQTTSEMRSTAASAGKQITRVLREQPLVLAGLGLAIGGLLGAILPTTEIEDKVMGDASDKMKDKIRDTASEAVDKGNAVVKEAWKEARQEASNQGLLPLNQATSENANKSNLKGDPEASLVPQGQEGGEQGPGGR
jgi:hypothetical protein